MVISACFTMKFEYKISWGRQSINMDIYSLFFVPAMLSLVMPFFVWGHVNFICIKKKSIGHNLYD